MNMILVLAAGSLVAAEIAWYLWLRRADATRTSPSVALNAEWPRRRSF